MRQVLPGSAAAEPGCSARVLDAKDLTLNHYAGFSPLTTPGRFTKMFAEALELICKKWGLGDQLTGFEFDSRAV